MLDEEGHFHNGPFPIDHAGMALAFATWIRRHPDDGRFILTNGYDWTYFTVKSTPFFVQHLAVSEGSSGRTATLRLSDGTEEPLDPSRVRVDPDGVLYTDVKGGEYEARFLPKAQSAMVDLVEEGDDGRAYVAAFGQRHPILPR